MADGSKNGFERHHDWDGQGKCHGKGVKWVKEKTRKKKLEEAWADAGVQVGNGKRKGLLAKRQLVKEVELTKRQVGVRR